MMFFWALRRPIQHIKRFTVPSLAIFFLQPVLTLVVLATFLSATILGAIGIDLLMKFMFTTFIFAIIALFSTTILRKRGIQISGFMFLPAFMLWYIIVDQVMLPLLALLTFDEKGWSSR